jgi:hypothetical protein
MTADEELETHAESIGEYVERFFGSKEFTWFTPRTRDSLNSIRVRFTRREFDRVIKPKKL